MAEDKDLTVTQKTQRAINYLADTDETHARARANYHALSEMRKTVRAFCFQEAEGGVKEREMAAECATAYIDHIDMIEQAEIEFHVLHNKRKSAEMIVELYRTYSANVRKGNI